MKYRTLTILAAIAFCAGAQALELPDIISPGAVLQQNSDARLWGWAAPGAEVTVTPSWSDTAVTAVADRKTGRWETTVATPAASYTPHTIRFQEGAETMDIDNVLVGEVWFCSGQSNMEMPLRGFGIQHIDGGGRAIAYSGRRPAIRMATVPKSASYTPQERTTGKWKVSSPENAPEFSALAYFFAESLQDIIDTPVGIINCAYGGSKVEGWMPKEMLDGYPGWDMAAEENNPDIREWERIGVMYNAMLLPVAGYTVKGFLWNQGESNVGRHDEYPYHQKDMVEHWRKLWADDSLPFYFVELPGWKYGDGEGTSAAYFRECQHKAAEITPNSGVVCTTDLVDPVEIEDIHAARKQPIGERLAFMAAARTYGNHYVPNIYPRFESADIQGDKAVIKIANAHGGLNPNRQLQGFEVAGDDKVFYPATAEENWDTFEITVTAPEEVKEIKSVRYCFKNFAIGMLKDMMGQPLIPFRTDDWADGESTSHLRKSEVKSL